MGACGICGSDLPRTFEHGSSNGKYPLTIGHEFAGEVVAVGEKADPSLLGAKGAIYPIIPCRKCEPCLTANYAMCEDYDYLGSRRDGGFAEYCLIPSVWHLICSAGADMETLAMTEPACVAQHAVRASGVQAGQLLVIYGAGPIGMMAARWASVFGARALLVDIAEDKVLYARMHGLDAVNSRTEDVCNAVQIRNGGRFAECAIEGTGASAALVGCVQCLRARGNLVLMGNPMGNTTIPLKIHSMILRKELTLQGIWNSSRAPYPIDEWQYAVAMMDAGRLVTADLITDRLTLEEMPEAMQQIRDRTRKIVKGMVVR